MRKWIGHVYGHQINQMNQRPDRLTQCPEKTVAILIRTAMKVVAQIDYDYKWNKKSNTSNKIKLTPRNRWFSTPLPDILENSKMFSITKRAHWGEGGIYSTANAEKNWNCRPLGVFRQFDVLDRILISNFTIHVFAIFKQTIRFHVLATICAI